MSSTAQPTPTSERRSFGETLAEVLPLIEFIPGYGPPLVLAIGPWVFLVLMLAGPFAFLVALVVVMVVAAAAVVALTAAIFAILAAPFRLVRHLRRERAPHTPISAPPARAVAIGSPRVAA
jgi:hypothetical protein